VLSFVVRNHALTPVRKPLPKLRTGWALVRVRLAGICNTDVEILRGYHAFRGTPGHEFVGEVVDVRGVSRRTKARWAGRRVVGEINMGCAALGFRPVCRFCRHGLKTHCARRKVLGITAHDGAFAEYLALPLENLHEVPDNVSDEQAVFVEPIAAACEILTQVSASKFRRAAVLGDGKLAQLIARVLHSVRIDVVLFGKHRNKLALARRAGIETRKVSRGAMRGQQVREGFPLVVEATGSATGLTFATQITEPRGTLVLKSTFHGPALVEMWPVVVKEINVLGSRCGPFERALTLLRTGRIDLSALISRTFPLAEANAAMKFAQHRGVLKVLLRP
jgi:threonine dehydrogenase-like Zn-dependent dehydrogenase